MTAAEITVLAERAELWADAGIAGRAFLRELAQALRIHALHLRDVERALVEARFPLKAAQRTESDPCWTALAPSVKQAIIEACALLESVIAGEGKDGARGVNGGGA